MDSLGLQPIIDYLRLFHLPSFPSIVKKQKNGSHEFRWVTSIAEIKRTIGLDVVFGFDIFPDPANRTRNRIVLGTPETNSVLPL